MKTAKVNENAYDTWLEPYIGWEFKVHRVTRDRVYFYMDRGYCRESICHHYRKLFDL